MSDFDHPGLPDRAAHRRPRTRRSRPAAQLGRRAPPVNVFHLVFGVAFLGMVVNWALIESGTVETHNLRWLLPIPGWRPARPA